LRGRAVRGVVIGPFAYEQYLRGALAMEHREPAVAAEHFRAALSSDETSGFLYAWLARAELRRGAQAAAEEAIAQAIVVEPDLELAWVVRGEIAEAQGGFDEARDAFETAVDLEPAEEEPSLDFGAFLERRADRSAAVQEYERLLARTPAAVRVRRALGLALLDLGELARGVGELERVVRASGGERESLLRLATAQMTSGNLARAAELFRASMASEDRAQSGRRGLIECLLHMRARGPAAEEIRRYRPAGEPAGVALERARLTLRAEDFELAIGEAEHALAARPELEEARLVLGLGLEGSGRRDQAMRTLAAIPSAAPVFAEARAAMARILWRIGEVDGARAILEDALLVSPSADVARLALARLFVDRDDIVSAQATLAPAQSPEARVALARLWLRDGRRAAATELLRQVAGRHPSDPAVAYLLARIEIEARAFDAAQDRLERVLHTHPADARALALLGVCAARDERPREARTLADRAVVLGPVDPEVLALAAEVDEIRGEHAAALAGYRKALRFGPDRDLRNRLETRIRRVAARSR
jgi:tetratricopeptide (TPR) repeat protein